MTISTVNVGRFLFEAYVHLLLERQETKPRMMLLHPPLFRWAHKVNFQKPIKIIRSTLSEQQVRHLSADINGTYMFM